jgi:hypothetical protein
VCVLLQTPQQISFMANKLNHTNQLPTNLRKQGENKTEMCTTRCCILCLAKELVQTKYSFSQDWTKKNKLIAAENSNFIPFIISCIQHNTVRTQRFTKTYDHQSPNSSINQYIPNKLLI